MVETLHLAKPRGFCAGVVMAIQAVEEAARERKEADRRDAENEQIENDAGRMYEQAVVMGDAVEPSIPPPAPGDAAAAEEENRRR